MNLAMLLVATLVSQTADDRLVVSPGARLIAIVAPDADADMIDIGDGTVLRVEPFTWAIWKVGESGVRVREDTVNIPQRGSTDQRLSGAFPGTFRYIQETYRPDLGSAYMIVKQHDALEIDGTAVFAIELLDRFGFTYWLIPKASGQDFISRRDVLTKFRVFPPARARSETTKQREGY